MLHRFILKRAEGDYSDACTFDIHSISEVNATLYIVDLLYQRRLWQSDTNVFEYGASQDENDPSLPKPKGPVTVVNLG